MDQFQQDLTKIALDKGLLALVVLIAGAVFSRSLERLKSSLSWGAEVLKQKLSMARELMTQMRTLEHLHLQAIGHYCISGGLSKEGFESFMQATTKLQSSTEEARLLFSPATVSAIGDTRDVAMRWLLTDSPPAGLTTTSTIDESESGEVQFKGLSNDVKEWLKGERDALEKSVKISIAKLQGEFPDLTGMRDGGGAVV